MFRPLARPVSALGRSSPWHFRHRLFSSPVSVRGKAASDPLRILFCGSEEFSCESLAALHREHVSNGRLVEALEVMVRPAKRTGRGLKHLRQVPCKALAEELGLRVHERDTFTGWPLPEGVNLVVAVSFGLFVPPRILKSAKYGGLNVHPSSLPHLRGPAPIHHAILRGDQHIGITLQSLDEKAFDHGAILAQTPVPGLPIPPESSVQELTKTLAVEGAQLLIQGLRDGVHVPPLLDVGQPAREAVEQGPPVHAPKVTKADSQVDWQGWAAEDFTRRMRVFGNGWTHAMSEKGECKRVLFLDAEPVAHGEGVRRGVSFVQQPDGTRLDTVMEVDEGSGCCTVRIREGLWIRVRRVKVDGKPEQAAANGLRPFMTKPS